MTRKERTITLIRLQDRSEMFYNTNEFRFENTEKTMMMKKGNRTKARKEDFFFLVIMHEFI